MRDHDPIGKVTTIRDQIEIPDLPRAGLNWKSIEESLGFKLPEDYVELVESLPPGRFADQITLIYPGELGASPNEYLGYYALRLEDMRMARAEGDGNFPYPIYPEVGGLLPWGRGPEDETYFWVTQSVNPCEWATVSTDEDFVEWRDHPGMVADIILSLLCPEDERNVRTAEQVELDVMASLRGDYCDLLPAVQGTVNIRSAELCDILPRPRRNITVPVDWLRVEEDLGFGLPDDYKKFVDTFGAGLVCDISIASPGSSCMDLMKLIKKKNREAAQVSGAELISTFSETARLIPWGETRDGWTCAWDTEGEDPNQWRVVYTSPTPLLGAVTYCEDDSFSSFLLTYVLGGYAFVGREPWDAPPSFTPEM